MLTIPAPTLPAAPPVLEKPVEIMLAGLAFGDGSPVGGDQATTIGVLVFKSSGEVWDEAAKGWRTAPADPDLMALKPVPAVAGEGGWKATLVAAGQKDAGGTDAYVSGTTCHVRALARARRGGQEEAGLSPPTADFTFASLAQNQRFTVGFDTPSTPPDQAHVVRLVLKDDALVSVGHLEIRAGTREVEVASCDAGGTPRARIVLQADGSIHLAPAAGQRVVVGGDAEVGRLLYQPQGGGPKAWLA